MGLKNMASTGRRMGKLQTPEPHPASHKGVRMNKSSISKAVSQPTSGGEEMNSEKQILHAITESFKEGQNSCAAGPWCRDMNTLPDYKTVIIELIKGGIEVGEYYANMKEFLVGDMIVPMKEIKAFAEVRIPEGK
jgi:hypothetical protein